MRAPDGLGPAGRAFWKRLEARFGVDAVDQSFEQARAASEARDLEVFALRAWLDAGRPLTCEQTNGVVGKHPLWSVLLEARREAARSRGELATVIGAKRGRGRPAGAVSAPDRVATPKLSRLKAV